MHSGCISKLICFVGFYILLCRGMAMDDPKAEHGLRLTIEDYPFASNGLLKWTSIKQWATDFVNHYYETQNDVLQDWDPGMVRDKNKGSCRQKNRLNRIKFIFIKNKKQFMIYILFLFNWTNRNLFCLVRFSSYTISIQFNLIF